MSLYNQLFGMNQAAPVLLAVVLKLDLEAIKAIPRFRDCYISEDGNEIIIYTRTGGGNRAEYEAQNEKLRQIPGFLGDEDDSFDSTYAYFRYAWPDDRKHLIPEFIKRGAVGNPAKRWKELLHSLQYGKNNPDVERAMTVGKEIFRQIDEAFKKP